MSEEITASYKIETKPFLDGLKWHRRQKAFQRMVVVLLSICGLLIAAHLQGSVVESMTTLLVILIGGGLAGFFSLSALARYRFTQSIRSMPVFGLQSFWTINEQGVRIAVGASHSFIAWEHVKSAMSTPDGVMILHSLNLFSWLPKSAFASEADNSRMLELVATKTLLSKIE